MESVRDEMTDDCDLPAILLLAPLSPTPQSSYSYLLIYLILGKVQRKRRYAGRRYKK
uniref:Uncharacterized protein n=1 Tax=Rhizophora mucronata TaxID=61149 RepID=A0A2P2Q4V5_RHIMU